MFDSLFFGFFANEQSAFLFGDDEVIDALYDGFFAGLEDDYIAVGFVEMRFGMEADVAVGVFVAELIEAAPCAEIGPTEGGRKDEDIVGFLHDTVVDGYIRAFGEDLFDEVFLFIGPHEQFSFTEAVGHLRQEVSEGLADGLEVPDEDAAVPEKISALEEDLRHLEVGFLGKGLDREDAFGDL